MAIRFVVVDDAAFIREVLIQMIKKCGGELVGEADNGEDAVSLVLQMQPDIVFMDVVMPKKSGIQATQEILSTLPNIKIIACSTEGSENMIFRALEAGCVDYLIKPFTVAQVSEKIKKLSSKTGEKNG